MKTEQPVFKPVTAGPAGELAEQPVSMAPETGEPSSGELESEDKSATTVVVKMDVKTQQPMSKPVTAGPAGVLAEQPMSMAQETGEPASDELESKDKLARTEVVKADVKTEQPISKPVTAGPAGALADRPISMAQETGEPSSGELESEDKSATPGILKTDQVNEAVKGAMHTAATWTTATASAASATTTAPTASAKTTSPAASATTRRLGRTWPERR